MKTNATRTIAVFVFFLLILLFLFISGNAQPRYDFRNATRISGADKKVGALYRFPNVRTGTDALVTITAITGGLVLNTLDGTSSGFAEAFQPVITAPANAKGYVEFNIVFVTAGTSTPMLQTEVPVTPIDVDGQAGIVYEFDEIYRHTSSYVDYNMLGGEVQINFPSTSWVQGMNTAGINYPGVDTTAKQAMFTVVNAGISSFTVRTGADNKSDQSQQRLRSLYFQRFTYPSSVLLKQHTPVVQIIAETANYEVFKIYPTIIQSNATVTISSDRNSAAIFSLVDYSGRIVLQRSINLQKGINSTVLDNMGIVARGSYIAMINFNGVMYNRKVIKQ